MNCPFPIWSIFITVDKTNPSTIRPETYREPFWKGRAIVCVNDQSVLSWMKTAGQTGGSAGFQTVTVNNWDGSSETVVSGSGTSTNYQPSISAYIWKRVSSTSNFNPFNVDTSQDGGRAVWDPYCIQTLDHWVPKPQSPNPYYPS